MQRVLIVDDEHLVADTLQIVFRKSGFETRVAYCTDDALALARESAPDLLLCDITMPGRDGLDLVEEMSRELPGCRILFLTGFYSNLKAIHEQTYQRPQSVDFLTKPCQPDDLLRKATALLMSA